MLTAQEMRAALNAHPRLALAVYRTLKRESGHPPSLVEWYLRFDSSRIGRIPWPSVAQTQAQEYQHLPQGRKDVWGFFTAP